MNTNTLTQEEIAAIEKEIAEETAGMTKEEMLEELVEGAKRSKELTKKLHLGKAAALRYAVMKAGEGNLVGGEDHSYEEDYCRTQALNLKKVYNS